MNRRPPRSTRTDTLFPYTTLLRSVKIAPNGITLAELIAEHCGGMAEGHTLKAYLPGGASGGILPAAMADLPLAFGSLEAHGCFVGSRSEEHTSELQSLMRISYAVFCLKNKQHRTILRSP